MRLPVSIFLIVLITASLLTPCGLMSYAASKPEVYQLPPAPESYRLDVPIIYAGLEGETPGIMCHHGAFAMVAEYHDPELEFSDIIAYSGVGNNAIYLKPAGDEPAVLANGLGPTSLIHAARNLDTAFILGLGEGGQDSLPRVPVRFIDEAAEVVYFSSSDEALDYLKRVIASDHPVVVYLDRYYLYDDLAPLSDFWASMRGKAHGAHFLTVTGYDEEYIYLNDPTDPTEAAANLPAQVDNFLLAWRETQELTADIPLGPYWMMYVSQLGTKKSVDEVVAWNVKIAQEAPSVIRKFAADPNDSDKALKNFRLLAIVRLAFADFLDKNGMGAAAALYRESGDTFAELAEGDGQIASDLNAIAEKEEQALQLLVGVLPAPKPTLPTPEKPKVTVAVGKAQISIPEIAAGKTAKVTIERPEETGVKAVQIAVKNSVNNIQINITKLDKKPASVTVEVEGKVYRYLNIAKENIKDEDISTANINFQVEKSWINSNNIDKATIALQRYEDAKWNKLPTIEVNEDAENVYYEAETPGLSIYTITGETVTPAPTPTPEEAPTPEETPTPTPEEEEKVDKGCIIATSTYGSALAPEVQFLRTFREETVYSTFAGSSFMAVFNQFYYSWSPAIASQIWQSETLQTVGRVVISPLLGILHISTMVNSAFSFNPELAIVLVGLVTAILIGAVYFTLPTLIPLYALKRRQKSLPKVKHLKPLLVPWTAGLILISLGEASASPLLMMIATGTFVVFTVALTAGAITLKAVHRLPQ